MINQVMETMEFKRYLLFSLVFLLVVALVMAKGLSELEPAQISQAQVLDSSYVVKSDGVYFKGLKQDFPIVWIDKKIGDVYHVDSIKTFDKVANESVSLEFYYDIQPDWIAHYTHSGKFDRYYFPTQWDWISNCIGEICNGGWVTIEVENIEEGVGSSTFPIGVTGPTWARDGEFKGEFDGVSSFVQVSHSTSINFTVGDNYSISGWFKNNNNYATTDRTVIGKWLPSQVGGFPFACRIQAVTNTFFCFAYNGTDSSNSVSTTILNNQWYNFNVVYNSTNINLYLDGVLIEIDLNDLTGNYSTNNIGIGRRTNGFNGLIDEVLIYNRSLTQSEITSLFNNYTLISTGPQRTGTPSTFGLVLDINFDDFSVADNSGEGNHGTNTNVSFGVAQDVNITLTENTDYTLVGAIFTIMNNDLAWTGITTLYSYTTNRVDEPDYAVANDTELALGEFGNWFKIIVIVGIAGVILFLILNSFGRQDDLGGSY